MGKLRNLTYIVLFSFATREMSVIYQAATKDAPKLASLLGVEEDMNLMANDPGAKKTFALHKPPKMYGHRGSLYEEPENTIPSFRRALDYGIQGIELDVFLLEDGSLAVFHGDGGDQMPGGLEGYFGVEGSIMNLTYSDAKLLQFTRGNAISCPEGKLEGARIPLLEDVLTYVKENYAPTAEVKIELKGPNTELPVIEMVEQFDMVDRVTYISFYGDRIHNVRKLRPQRHEESDSHVYRTGFLWSVPPADYIQLAQDVNATEIHLRYDMCSKERVNAIHAAGFDSTSWFRGPAGMKYDMRRFREFEEEGEGMYELVWRTGVRAMTVNRPGRLINLMKDLEWRMTVKNSSQ
mmetsp:Transcript_13439/g.25690  ORF Transcript_13439/g.25690 Transcript_13439/m.25690 type:complete len:350 (+) Transcript_13439:261-1310(+)